MNKSFLQSILVVTLLLIIILFTRSISVNEVDRKTMRLTDKKTDPEFINPGSSAWVDSIMDTLSLEQKIGQLIMVSAYSDVPLRNDKKITELIKNYQIGGLIFLQGSPYKQAVLTNFYQSISSTPLLIAMDAECGLGMKLDSTIRYPSQMMLGALENDRLIFNMGGQIAQQLKRLGVHVNFAPVVDINNNPDNPVIGSRSFGEDLMNVSRKSLFYMIGLEHGGIISVAKHFPGHGDTDVDSHNELPVINYSRKRLDSLELFPFKELIYNGISGIMTAHLHVPAIDNREFVPSSLSEFIVDSLLRKGMGFKGLVFTDALEMKGISDHFKPVEAAKRALLAGNDILLQPDKISDVIKELTKMVNQGKISQSIIDEHCRRVLSAKYWVGLNKYKPVELKNLTPDLNKPEYQLLQRNLIESSITLLENKNSFLPLKRLDTLKVASVIFSDKKDSFFNQNLKLYTPVETIYIRGDGFDNIDSILTELKKYNLLIISIHAGSLKSSGQYGISDCTVELVDTLLSGHNAILDLFASPYLLKRISNVEGVRSLIVSYDNTPLVQSISAQSIFGAVGFQGTIPVTSMQWQATKSGHKTTASGRFKFSIPAEVNMNSDSLKKIDEIVNNAIESQAFPGCQVLVARKGCVILNKAYGNFSYNHDRAVTSKDIYDLASITKVAATTPAIMHFYEEGCVGLDQKISAYLPYLEKSNKRDIIVSDILIHRSGLQSFIPFYFSVKSTVFKGHKLIATSSSDANPIKIGPGQYMNRYTDFKDEIISTKRSDAFPLRVGDNIYLMKSWPDTMYKIIAASSLKSKKEYVYSDLGFILLKQMIDSVSNLPFDMLVDSLFYKKLGAGTLCFNPLKRFEKDNISPTEDDIVFRKQLLQGYVHDESAAMLGGISGNAGLFGNALDLAKLFQMYLNNGEYGGERYLNESTVKLFTKRVDIKGNRRGLGFDKPEPDNTKPGPSCKSASPESFGHTGFTGTMVWADPENDLVFVFLSNRVNPDASNNKLVEMNVRTNVQQVIYNSIMNKK